MPAKNDRNKASRLAGARRVPVVRSQSYFSYNKCVSVVPIAQIFGVREHTHEFFELVLVAQGTCSHSFLGHDYPLTQRDAFIVPPGETHAVGHVEGLIMLNVMYLPDMLSPSVRNPQTEGQVHPVFLKRDREISIAQRGRRTFRLGESDYRDAFDLIRHLGECLRLHQISDPLQQERILWQILALMTRAVSASPQSATTEPSISKAVAFIQRNLSRNITVSELAAECAMSERTLLRYFKREIAMPPLQYLVKLRIQRARERLSGHDVLVKEVASEVGFTSMSHFARSFRQHVGMAPNDYQKKMRHTDL